MAAPSEITGDLVSNGHNIVSDVTVTGLASTDQLVDPDTILGALADNGGAMPTHALLPNSLALDGGRDADAVGADGRPLVTDQRGEPRWSSRTPAAR